MGLIADVHLMRSAFERSRGLGGPFFKIDLMKGTLEQMRAWLAEKGIEEDHILIYGFVDWGVEKIMSLVEAYCLKQAVVEIYDGDDFIIRHLLQRRKSVREALAHYYVFYSRDEKAVIRYFLEGKGAEYAVELFYACRDWHGLVMAYVDMGYILLTPRGFYINSEYLRKGTNG